MIEVLDGRRFGFVIHALREPDDPGGGAEACRNRGGGVLPAVCVRNGCHPRSHLVLPPEGRPSPDGPDLYGGTTELLSLLLPRLGVSWKRIDMGSLSRLRAGPVGQAGDRLFRDADEPLLRVVDGPGVVRRARDAGAKVIVDNTFATPILQNPLSWGVDLVVHSATKYLGGHSDLTLGAVIGRDGHEEGHRRRPPEPRRRFPIRSPRGS